MEQFEEDISSHLPSGRLEYQGVEELESEAFNRGLPENSLTPRSAGDHGLSDSRQWGTGDFEHAAPVKTSPVILLIDDEKPFRNVLKQVLSTAGYEVVEAANGAEGIDRFYDNPADLIITDIIMPEKEGAELISEFQRDFPDAKIIAISGGGKGGVDDYLKDVGSVPNLKRAFQKPFSMDEMLQAIKDILE